MSQVSPRVLAVRTAGVLAVLACFCVRIAELASCLAETGEFKFRTGAKYAVFNPRA